MEQGNTADRYVLFSSGEDVSAELLELQKRFKKADLDAFLTRVYNYYRGKGLACVLLTQVFNVLLVLWVAVVTAFALEFVNYRTLFSDPDVVDAIDLHFPINPIFWCFVAVMTLFVGWQTLRVLKSIPGLLEVRDFYRRRLMISDNVLQTMRWNDVVQQIIRADLSVKKTLDELDVAHSIMRKENYFIAMVNRKVVPLTITLPVLGECVLLSRLLEFCLFRIIFTALFNKQEKHLRVEVLGNDSGVDVDRRRIVQDMQSRFKFWGILLAIFSPFMFLFLFAYTVIRFGEEVKTSPSALSTRQWSLLARWRFREFNELPHYFQQRLGLAFNPAEDYVNQFPSYLLATISRFVLFIFGSVLVIVLILSFLDGDLLVNTELFGRTGVWYIGVCGVVIAGCRALIPDPHTVFQPEAIMTSAAKYTHYLPHRWVNRCHEYETYFEFDILFEYRALAFLRELVSVVVTPYLLYFYLPTFAEDIVTFFASCTDVAGEDVEDGIGNVCSYANFSFKKHGNKDFGAPHSTGIGQSLHGKMEQSFLNFRATYPAWTPSPDGEALLGTLSAFLKEHPYLVQNRNSDRLDLTTSRPSLAPDEMRDTNALLELDPSELNMLQMTFSAVHLKPAGDRREMGDLDV